METHIYKLIDPTDNSIRYVGKTRNIKERYRAHCNKARIDPTQRCEWLQSLLQCRLKPIMEVIESVSIVDGKERERYWTKYYIDRGCSLTNYTKDGLSFGNQTSFIKGMTNKEVLVFNLKGTLVNTCASCQEAQVMYGKGVGNVVKMRSKTQKGLIFVYTEIFDGDVDKLVKWATTKNYKVNSGSFKKGQISMRSKKVEVVIVTTGETLIFDSAKTASEGLKLGVGLVQYGCTHSKSIIKKQYKMRYL